MENFLGSLGLSYGQMYADLNRAANNTFNQLIDSATMANVGSFIVPELFDFEPGNLEIAPGVINRVSGAAGLNLRDSIIELRPQPANPQMFTIVDKLSEYGQSFGAQDILSGASGKSGESARGQEGRIEQALKQLSVAGKKFTNWLEQIFRNNAELNAMNLSDEEIHYVTDSLSKQYEQIVVTRKMYERNYQVTIRADMRFSSKAERVQEADELVSMPKAVPPLMGNLAWWHGAASRALKARGCIDMIPLLGPKPPLPETPMGVQMGPPPGAGGPPPPGQGGSPAPPQGQPPGPPQGPPPGPPQGPPPGM